MELREQEELLLSIRNEGGDVLAADETEDDVHIVVTHHWKPELPTTYQHATFVTPAYIHDRLNSQSLLQPNATLDHQPLPEQSTHLPSFATYLFALTGFNRHEQDQLKRLLTFLGAKGVTDGMHGRNTHLLCKEGCAAGKKWELAWSGGWKGKVVRLQWLVECVRQGKELPLTDELAWKKVDESEESRPDHRGPAAVSELEQAGTDERQHNAGKRASVNGTHAAASASPPIDVDMHDAAQQPELQNGRQADEEDVDKTEQDSTAEHMDVDMHNTTPAPRNAPNPTHDTAEEQADILGPLPPPSPSSINSSPFPTRYGRQHGQRTNRIYTPPKTPNSVTTSPADDNKGSGDKRARRRRLAVEDKGGAQHEHDAVDPFGFQGADDVKEDRRNDEKAKDKPAVTASVKDKAETSMKKRQQVDEEKSDEEAKQSRNGHTTKADGVQALSDSKKASAVPQVAINGKRGGMKQLEDELEHLDEAVGDKQEEREATRHNESGGAERDDTSSKSKGVHSRLPGRKRLNTERRDADDEEAEYVPPAAEASEAEATEAAHQPPASDKKQPSRATKAQKAVPAEQDKGAEKEAPQSTSTRKGRARSKRSGSSASETSDEQAEAKDGKMQPSESKRNTHPPSSDRKSARAQRKEQLKAQDVASPVKARPGLRTAPQRDSDSNAHDSNQPARTTRKRSAAQADDAISVDSGDSTHSAAKRAKATATTAVAEDESNKYRFAISSYRSWSADKAATLREMIEQLGAEYIDEADDYSLCSAVVVKDRTQLKRTEKVLAAIVAGLPILPRSYIEDSSQRGKFLSLAGYRLTLKDAVDETGKVLMKAAERWQKRRPFDGRVMWIADSKQEKMLTNILGMGGGTTESRDLSECTDCLVDADEPGVEAVLKRMWNAGVPVYRSAMVVEYICYGDQREWNMDDFKLTKDNWQAPGWSNPWKGETTGSQSTHGTESGETDGRKRRR